MPTEYNPLDEVDTIVARYVPSAKGKMMLTSYIKGLVAECVRMREDKIMRDLMKIADDDELEDLRREVSAYFAPTL